MLQFNGAILYWCEFRVHWFWQCKTLWAHTCIYILAFVHLNAYYVEWNETRVHLLRSVTCPTYKETSKIILLLIFIEIKLKWYKHKMHFLIFQSRNIFVRQRILSWFIILAYLVGFNRIIYIRIVFNIFRTIDFSLV